MTVLFMVFDLIIYFCLAHKANVHGQTSKQARTIEFQFNLAPRGRPNQENVTATSNISETMPTPSMTSTQQRKTIDARNEQEFPSLGGNAPINIRPTVALNMRFASTSGLARTKENFPALGGSSSNNREPFKPPSSGPSVNASTLLFKIPAKMASTNNTSNKPNAANKTKTVPIKSHDFPALPGSSSSSRSQRANLENDMIETPLTLNSSVVSAKHRALVQTYESVSANMMANQKIKTIQQAETKLQSVSNEKVPSIKSKDNFPALGGALSLMATAAPVAASAPQWLNGTNGGSKKPTQISKKLKVAPAPLLPSNKSYENNKKDEDVSKKAKTNDKSKANDKKKDTSKTENSNEKNGSGKKEKAAKKSDENAKKTKENNEKNAERNGNGNKHEKKSPEFGVAVKPEQNGGTTSNGTINSYSSVAHFTMPPPGFPAKNSENKTKVPPGFENLSTDNRKSYTYMSPSNALQRNQVCLMNKKSHNPREFIS